MSRTNRLIGLLDGFLERGQQSLSSKRIKEVSPKEIKSITDMRVLIDYWKDAPPYLKEERLIEKRILELLAEISIDNVPEWFEDMLKSPVLESPLLWPDFLEEPFDKKVKELRDALVKNS